MPAEIKSIPITFANSGIVLRSTPDEIPLTAYKALANVFTDQENSITVRKGFTRLNNGLPTPPYSSYSLTDYNGDTWRYAIANRKLHIGPTDISVPFSEVTGAATGSLLSPYDDPRALFANYTLAGTETKPYIFFADGYAFRKHPGSTDPRAALEYRNLQPP